ncbi:MAG: Kazal-type serine protease inhibitor domain-containing protein [Myxococcota bacterium]
MALRRRLRIRRWVAAWLGGWAVVAATGCVTPAEEDGWETGELEEPGLSESAVYDEALWRVVPDAALPESAHPYANRADESTVVTTAECVQAVRVHFEKVELKGGDSLTIYNAAGRQVQRLSNTTRTNFVSNPVEGNQLTLRLRSNRSTRGWGFKVDRVEVVEGAVVCSRMMWRSCAPDQVTLAPAERGLCQCPAQPVCAPLSEFEASYGAGGGFTGGYSGRVLRGNGQIVAVRQLTAGDPVQETVIAYANATRLQTLANEVQNTRFLTSTVENVPGNMTSLFSARQGTQSRERFWPTGETTPADMETLITLFTKATSCGPDADMARCAPGHRCQDGECVETLCSCAEIFQPVCGVYGNFYENPCMASCANEPIKHNGWCGLQGDECGGLRGLECAEHFLCQYTDGTNTPSNSVEIGTCVSAEPGCGCGDVNAPVCTTDDQTYPSACHAGCEGKEIRHQGACGSTGDTCGTIRGLTCAPGYHCEYEGGVTTAPYPDAGGTCVADQGCICPRFYDPQCGDNQVTYGNTCEAACANVGIVHRGECGQDGDACGGRRGLTCAEGFKCQYSGGSWEVTFPDEVGTCRPTPGNWCDVPTECGLTVRLSCPANWFCENHQCRYECIVTEHWELESARFETAHPYRNNQSLAWTATGEVDTQAVRFIFESFSLEEGYDFVLLYDEGWNEVARYTGELGAFTSAEVSGRVAHLVFRSDASVVQQGFVGVGVEYKRP